MTGSRKSPGRLWAGVGILVGIWVLCAQPAAGVVEYLQDDATITGDQINYFRDRGEMVSVVVGNFRLAVAGRTISGRKGVIWIKTKRSGSSALHDLAVYVEDEAEVIEADGSATHDKLMLVKLYVQGRISASGSVSSEPLKDLPLYRRAVRIRRQEAEMLESRRRRASRGGLPARAEPSVVVRPSARDDQPPKPEPKPEPERRPEVQPDEEPAEPRTVDLESLAGAPSVKPAPAGADVKTAAKIKSPKKLSAAEKPAPQPTKSAAPVAGVVHLEAPGGVTIEKDPNDPSRRIAMVKGKVYLSQGTRDSGEFLELRADSAVIFSRDDVVKDKPDEKVPYAPKLIGLSGGGEAITGVYLEGDVIINRGERKMTGRAAYYDFVNERAIILEPVMRTVQEQRNIPVYIRASKARMLSPREIKFYNAIVSTSDFKTPTYSLGAREVLLRDETPYDKDGEKIGEQSFSTEFKHATWDIRGVPVFYMPSGETSFEEGHSALRKAVFGKWGRLGYGVETDWHLFRLLGMVRPEGMKATLHASGYERGGHLGVDGEYQKREENRQYSGYFRVDGVYDIEAEDDFGLERKNIQTRHTRGRILSRHKEFLPRDWQIQGEMSLMCDRNFLEEFFPDEFWTGKEQENLIYAKKQRDNWAITALMKLRMNDFLTQSEAYPEVAGHLVGQSLWEDRFTYFGEARVGVKRYRQDDEDPLAVRSRAMARFDTRHEINMPLEIPTQYGPLNVVPYATGRLTYWSDTPNRDDQIRLYNPDNYNWLNSITPSNRHGGGQFRAYAQGGVRANMHFWKVYNNVESRLWDVHRLKHIITPEVVAFGSAAGNVYPDQLYPLDPGVEQIIRQNSGVSVALRQRLQTRRGPAGNRRTVDWMRFNLEVGCFQNDEPDLKGDGRFFMSRPEYSLQRSFVNADYAWNISDSVSLLADMNYDLGDGQCDRLNIGVNVQRNPRLSYYAGMRYIKELDSAVGTLGVKYKINQKYTISAFEQYDFTYDGGLNLGTRVSIVRKFPRWYVGVTFTYDRRYDGDDQVGLVLALWPEGVPEARIGGRTDALLNQSDRN